MSDELHEAGCGCSEYNELSRRQFIGAAGAISAASLFPAWLPKIKLATSFASNRDIIVSIFMRGGADGLAIVAPFGDPAYKASRPTIGIPAPDDTTVASTLRGVNLDGFFCFAQAMAGDATGSGGLKPAFDAKDLLITHATGIQTNNSRSHFDAQRYVEVGKPADPTVITGWLGRHLALTAANPIKQGALLRGIGLSGGLQKTLVGAPKTLPIADPTNYTIGGSSTTQAQRLAFMQSDYASADAPVGAAALDAVNTVNLLKSVNFAGYKPANSANYNEAKSSFGRALRSVAALIKSDVGVEAAQLDIGGWDTHSAQGATTGGMRNLMQDFSNSLGAFYADVIAAGYPVTVVAISEFGRNVRENASLGTDHGRGTVSFSMGKGIAGGRVLTKNWKTLDKANLEAGQDLTVGIDYRDILAEIVQNRLGNPAIDQIFPGWTATTLGVTR